MFGALAVHRASLSWHCRCMLDDQLLPILRQGVAVWNRWRADNPSESIWLKGVSLRGMDLTGIDLHKAELADADLSQTRLANANFAGAQMSGVKICWAHAGGADFSRAWAINADLRFSNFERAKFEETWLNGANLTTSSFRHAVMRKARLDGCRTSEFQDSAPGYTYFEDADLTGAGLMQADLSQARMSRAKLADATLKEADLSLAQLADVDLTGANLMRATLSYADLSRASLRKANLEQAIMVRTVLDCAFLSHSRVYGIAAWDLRLEGCEQLELTITPTDAQATITVDDVEVAQFIYLLMSQQRLQSVIDTITSRTVLILGRFTPERRQVLDAIRESLRKRGYVPVLFDFEKPASRDLTETVRLLAHMARFIIADLSSPKSVPHELMALVPLLPSVPFQLLIHGDESQYSMVEHLLRFPWVLPVRRYANPSELIDGIDRLIIEPAETLAGRVKPVPLKTVPPPAAP